MSNEVGWVMGPNLKLVSSLLFASRLAATAFGDLAVADRPTLTMEGAKMLMAKAEAKARALHRSVNIAVVDSGGSLLAFERMDGAFLAGADLSIGKAQSALRFGEPTAKIEMAVHDGRYALITAGAVEMQGGIPISRGGVIVGAIGVSGADSSTDIPIAEAALTDPTQ